MALVQAFIQWHQRRMASHPYALNSAQSAVLMGIGDSVAQSLEMGRDEGKRYDPARLAILAAWAGGVNAPFWTWWNMALHRHWQGGRVAGWVLASASLSPLWNGLFFTWTTGLNHAIKQQEGSLRAKVQDKITTQLAPTVVKSCCLWVPFNFLNFRYCPLNYRMLSAGVVALGWNIFLSITANSGQGSPATSATAADGGVEDVALR